MGVNRKSTNTFTVSGELLTIKTKSGVEILADAEDLGKLQTWSWCINKAGYAVANIGEKIVRMHRYIMDADDGEVVDHKNRNILDNRKQNLRICTQQENMRNVRPAQTSKTGEVGIRMTKHNKFNVRITHNKKEMHIGNYDTLEEAIAARKVAEKKYHGEFGSHHQERGLAHGEK